MVSGRFPPRTLHNGIARINHFPRALVLLSSNIRYVGVTEVESGKVGYWLQIGGNVAILFGLLFVAAQLYQERQLKAIEMSMVLLDNALQVRLAMMGEEPYLVLAKTLEDTGELSRDDALVLSQIYAAELILYEQTTYMQRAGLWPEYKVAIPPTMRSKAGYRYLDANLARIPLSDSTKGIWRRSSMLRSLKTRLLYPLTRFEKKKQPRS